MRRLVPYCETSVVVGDIFVAIVTALVEAFLEAVAFVNEDGFKVARTVHWFLLMIVCEEIMCD